MATIANWNGHTFVVSPNLIRGFTDLSIKGSCETTDKNSDKQKYVERKYGDIPSIAMTIGLNAQTGVTDVFGEAQEFVKEATEGATAYFYMGSTKLIPAKMMLTEAEVTEIVIMPGQGSKWISCNVKVKFKQGSKNDTGGSGGSSGSSGLKNSKSNKASMKTHDLRELLTGKDTLSADEKKTVAANMNKLKEQVEQAKGASSEKVIGGLKYMNDLVDKATTIAANSANRITATTGRNCDITPKIITLIPTKPVINPDVMR